MSRQKKATLRRIKATQGAHDFEELRRIVKNGGDFCKDLSIVLHERAELESQYAKGLSKLSIKLLKASKEATGSVAHAWQAIAAQLETQAQLHKQWGSSLDEELTKPLRTSTETQHKIRKSVELLVDKTTKNLADWRTAEAKAKRHAFSVARDLEKIANNQPQSQTENAQAEQQQQIRPRFSPAPDLIKSETKRRKSEEAARRGDVDYYTFCIRTERARLEWEGSIRNGSSCLRTLLEEKLLLLSSLASKYLYHMTQLTPKLSSSVDSLQEPVNTASVQSDLLNLGLERREQQQQGPEQLLPHFYAEDSSNLMSKERRVDSLFKLGTLIQQDLERERKGVVGVENLAKAIGDSPTLLDNNNHDIWDKLYYIKSMMLYLTGAKWKVEAARAEAQGKAKPPHPLTQYIRHQRDKQGLPQTILKVPQWAREDCLKGQESQEEAVEEQNNGPASLSMGTEKKHKADAAEVVDVVKRNTNSVNGANNNMTMMSGPSIGRCRAIYDYDANLFDELSIRAGDEINIHNRQADGWWLGELAGKIGIFPATYVQEID